MGYIQGEGRRQGTLFPVVLDDLVPADHVCRVIDAFVDGLAMATLGFERAEAAETGRPGYDPRDLLKLYLYGYLNQIRSSRRLEAECCRNVELMWLLGRLYPDYKSIAEFRRMHREAVTAAGAELVRFARSCGLIRGEWIALDGTKSAPWPVQIACVSARPCSVIWTAWRRQTPNSRPRSIHQPFKPRWRSSGNIRNRRPAS
jgi:transposase